MKNLERKYYGEQLSRKTLLAKPKSKVQRFLTNSKLSDILMFNDNRLI